MFSSSHLPLWLLWAVCPQDEPPLHLAECLYRPLQPGAVPHVPLSQPGLLRPLRDHGVPGAAKVSQLTPPTRSIIENIFFKRIFTASTHVY